MGLRHIVIFACLFMTRCSGDPNAGFLNQLATGQRGSKDSGNAAKVQKSGDAGRKGDEEGNGRPKGEGSQAGDESGIDSDKDKLPEVYIDSDQALIPIASLTGDMDIDRGGYTFISQPEGSGISGRKKIPSDTTGPREVRGLESGDFGLTCVPYISQSGAMDASRLIQCDLDTASSSNRSGFFAPEQVSWSFYVEGCPDAQILGNVVLPPECPSQEAATCSYVRPALRLNMRNVQVTQCFAAGAKLTFTVREKSSKGAGDSAKSFQTPIYKQVLFMSKL